MTALYLTKPAILSSLGEGIERHIQHLLAAEASPLAPSDQAFTHYHMAGKQRVFGEVNTTLRPFPQDLPSLHASRNNQLLWHCLAQIEPQIERAIARFGRQRIAVVIGTSTTGVDENIPVFQYAVGHQDWKGAPFKQQQQYFSAPADFVAYQYGLQGLTYGISTACTSGAKALISAARLLNAELCDAVICGGVDALSPLTISGFGALSVLSDKRSNPLSANRDGINLGEGAAVFIMSRDKLTDDNIALLGYGASSDAYHMSSPHPEGKGAIAAFQDAVHQVFGDNTPCTTTKPYTGHTLGAAGAVEAAILWGTIDRKLNPNGKLPAQLWDQQREDTLSLINITYAQSHWQTTPRIGASSSFAFGGNNTVLILGERDD